MHTHFRCSKAGALAVLWLVNVTMGSSQNGWNVIGSLSDASLAPAQETRGHVKVGTSESTLLTVRPNGTIAVYQFSTSQSLESKNIDGQVVFFVKG